MDHILPWCIEVSSPTYFCRNYCCRTVPSEWKNNTRKKCELCNPGEYDYSREDDEYFGMAHYGVFPARVL